MRRQHDFTRRGLGGLALGLAGSGRTAFAQTSVQNSAFLRLWATRKISVEVPRSWTLVNSDLRIDMSAASEAMVRRLRMETSPDSELPLAANRQVDGVVWAWMNLRVYRDAQLDSQAAVRAASRSDLAAVDAEYRALVERSAPIVGYQLSRWIPTTRVRSAGGLQILLCHYERTGISGRPPATVRLARVLAGVDSFTLTCAYQTQRDVLFREVALRMIDSLEMQG